MDQMGYDAMALGPKELSLGAEILGQRMAQADLDIVSANVVWSSSQELIADPYTVLPLGEHRVGILGLTRQDVEIPLEFQVLDPSEALQHHLPRLMDQADLVIVLTNMSYRQARALLKSVEGVDLLVSALPGQLPDRAVRDSQTGTLAVVAEQALPRHSGRRVGRLVVTVHSDGALGEETWASVPMDGSIPDQPLMGRLLGQYLQP
jgi:2',3'-cyclic-nucleotide 2'-phosphodiesterase (5'-nucleotidase family)